MEDDESASIFPEFEGTCAFIRSHLENTNILVHCQGGVSRSSCIVIAFLMKERGIGREEARDYVKGRRKCIAPN